MMLCISVTGCGVSVFDDHKIDKHYLLLLHNKERAKRGIDQIEENEELNQYAQRHAEWMANHSLLIHSKLSLPNFNNVGENIAMGQNSEESVFNDWMDSSGHRKNILGKKYKKAGVGYAKFRDGRPYWCVVFGD